MNALVVAGAMALLLYARAAPASDILGTVMFQGQVVCSAPIPGIAATDLRVAVKPESEATGNGEPCTIQNVTSDSPDGAGA